MTNDSLRLLHLSDIHFRKFNFDPFEDLRNELERDAEALVHEVGPVSGILITGDIAFSGQRDEYKTALDWLEIFCGKVHCRFDYVWSIPGNHDVDRRIIDDSKLIRTIHQGLRAAGPENLDTVLEEYLQDKEAREMIYKPIDNYLHEFASKFNCKISADKPFIGHNFTLNDGSILNLRGVNSTLVSYKYDNNAENKLLLGSFQSTISREDGVEYLLMCHHPYQWLLDEDARKDHWSQRARIHLFGHKHNQRLDQINNSVVMTAGAMQPDIREPNWVPRYNLLEIHVTKENDQRLLNVNVYPRIWKEENQGFQPDFTRSGEKCRVFNLSIEKWSGEEVKMDQSKNLDGPSEGEHSQEKGIIIQTGSAMDSARKLTYRFLRLPYHKRIDIASKLDLLEDEDKGLQDNELFQRFFRKAKENNKLENLWNEVEIAHGIREISDNPYVNIIGGGQ